MVHPLVNCHQPMKRLLLISYAFPPVGGAGVQRPLKFAKYLPTYGWMPTVLTVANPSVPVLDAKLLQEVDANVTVLRARTLEPAYGAKRFVTANAKGGQRSWKGWVKHRLRSLANQLLQPDPQILWNANAYRKGLNHLRKIPHQAILVSGPPFSSFLLGVQLKRALNLPLVLDFRDEWSLASQYLENHRGDTGASRQQRYLEEVLRHADAIIATTQASARELTRCCQRLGRQLTAQTIYNGYDPDDFSKLDLSHTPSTLPSNLLETDPPRRLQLMHCGTLWRLTNVAPLLDALRVLERREPSVVPQLELTICGRRTPEQSDLIKQFSESTSILHHVYDYLPHREALRRLSQADIVCMLLSDEPGAERVVPGKLFECLALQKPILAIAPPGEATDLVNAEKGLPHGCFQPSQTEAMADWILQRLGHPEDHSSSTSPELAWCSRPVLTSKLASLLDTTLVESQQRRHSA